MAQYLIGIASALFVFVPIGILAPFVLQYFRPNFEQYITLPPSQEIWLVFLFFGALFALVEFLQNAYLKGDYHWLVGKLGSGILGFAFLSYIFFYMVGTPSLGSAGVEATGLVVLISVSIGLSYLHLFLDFYDARGSRRAKPMEAKPDSRHVERQIESPSTS